MKKFNYHATRKYENYIEEFVNSISCQHMEYLKCIQCQIPENSDELHYIIHDLLLTKDILATLQTEYFHDSTELVSQSLMYSLNSKVIDLSEMIDRVIIRLLETYYYQNRRI